MRVAICIPYRDRAENLAVLLRTLQPAVGHSIDLVCLGHQSPGKTFNRGMARNVAAHYALSRGATHLVLHDVDMAPENLDVYTTLPHIDALHLAGRASQFAYAMPYASYFGGVLRISAGLYGHCNGYSHRFVGWGGEDDDFLARVRAVGGVPHWHPGRFTSHWHARERPIMSSYRHNKRLAAQTTVASMHTDGLGQVPMYTHEIKDTDLGERLVFCNFKL